MMETDDDTVEQQFPYNVSKLLLVRYANVATVCNEDWDDASSKLQENKKVSNAIKRINYCSWYWVKIQIRFDQNIINIRK